MSDVKYEVEITVKGIPEKDYSKICEVVSGKLNEINFDLGLDLEFDFGIGCSYD